MSTAIRILVIDDQIGEANSPHQRAFLRAYGRHPYEFEFESCESNGRYDVSKAIRSLGGHTGVDIVLLDIKFGNEDDRLGFEILPLITAQFPAIPVLMMSSVDRDVESLGRCLEDGAVGFLRKGQKPDGFARAIEQALNIARSHVLLGKSPPLRELRRQAARLSPYDQIPVLIVGERGTGKDKAARYIHHSGPRTSGPFMAVNCAAIPESLVESELFGAEKGAYTGADSIRVGYIERAKGGVLFLDEVGNMALQAQAKLLRVLQDRTYRRVGVSQEELVADIQLICATNVDPEELIRVGKLREDFYDRIAAVTIRTPPLRECLSDVPELAHHFLRDLGLDGRKRLSRPAIQAMMRYNWPGNMRELRRVVQEAVVRSEQALVIGPDDLPPSISGKPASLAARGDAAAARQHLPDDSTQWARYRLTTELQLYLEAKRTIQRYKGRQWKAEFMRLMYPACKASSAKGFNDLIRRVTKSPWGDPSWMTERDLRHLIDDLVR